MYSLVKDFTRLPPPCKLNLVESLRSNLSVLLPNVELFSRASQNRDGNRSGDDSEESDGYDSSVTDRLASHRNAFKIYTFFLIHIVLIEEFTTSSNNNTKVNFVPQAFSLSLSLSFFPPIYKYAQCTV